MPFRSQRQRRYLYSQNPELAKRWRKESGPQKGLPERTARSTRREHLVRQFLQKQKRHGS